MTSRCYKPLLVLALMVQALLSWADVVVNRITIDVVLQADGSARITEVWDADVGQTEYTELYKTHDTHTNGTIENFTVSEQGREFIFNEYWDTKAKDKEGKCGLNPIRGGYELCWGIGKPGTHHYKLNYTVTHCIIPSGTENVMFDMVLYQADGLQPREVVATISRADSVLTEDDIVEYSVSENNTKAIFENGRFVLSTEHAMEEDDWLGARIEFPASAFGEIDRSALNTYIAPDEMTSPMMQDKNVEKYEESWLDKFWDFYHEWPLLTLFGILGGLIGLFYVVRKVAVALA